MCGKCEVAEEDAVCTEDKAAEEDAGSRGICWWIKLVTEGCGARRGVLVMTQLYGAQNECSVVMTGLISDNI